MTVTLTITQPTGVMDAEISPRSGRLDVNPNPSCAATALLFALPEPGEARLVIYDAAGRMVRELQSGESPAGEFAASWDGRDDRGERMAPGVYFARLEAPGFTATRKIALLR